MFNLPYKRSERNGPCVNVHTSYTTCRNVESEKNLPASKETEETSSTPKSIKRREST